MDATRAVVCLHGTDPVTVYLSAHARVSDLSIGDLDAALYSERALVKHLAMRRTLFVVPREQLGVVQAAASDRVAAAERRRLVKDVEAAGLHRDGQRWLRRAERQVVDALAEGREATASELREELSCLRGSITHGEGRSWGGETPIGPRVLTVLSASGQAVRASNDGDWTASRPRWAATRGWLGEPIRRVPRDEAMATLVTEWLQAFGPGTEEDIKWWLGSTLRDVRAALHRIAAVAVDLDGDPGWVLPHDVDEVDLAEPWAALLPPLDPTTMGWKHRDWYLGPHRDLLFDTSGNAGSTAWSDGRIVGGWRQDEDGAVELQLLEDVGREAADRLGAEADRLASWLGGRRVVPRFPSPLSKVSG